METDALEDRQASKDRRRENIAHKKGKIKSQKFNEANYYVPQSQEEMDRHVEELKRKAGW